MKKTISILWTIILVSSIILGMISCSKIKNYQNNNYFDNEINDIDPSIQNLVKYTSSIAKILIASRHENMNTYSFPTIQYFLNNFGKNLNGVFKTKNGIDIKIKDYVEEYIKLNNINYNPWKAINKNYLPEYNTYNLMSSIVEMTEFSKWNTKENKGHPSTKINESGRYNDFVVKPNLGWAQYDSGALVNTLSQKSESVINYINRTEKWSNYYNSSTGPYSSNIFFHNSISNPQTKYALSYKDGNQEIKFGKKIANQSIKLYDLFGLKYFNEAITMLGLFGPGFELPVLYSLVQLLPIVQNDRSGEKTSGVLLAAPFFILMKIRNLFFDNSGNVKKDSPLLEIFDRSTIENITIKVEIESDGEVNNPKKIIKEMNLNDILYSPIIIKSLLIISKGEKQYLDLTNNNKNHKNAFLKWYLVLSNWFSKALKKKV